MSDLSCLIFAVVVVWCLALLLREERDASSWRLNLRYPSVRSGGTKEKSNINICKSFRFIKGEMLNSSTPHFPENPPLALKSPLVSSGIIGWPNICPG